MEALKKDPLKRRWSNLLEPPVWLGQKLESVTIFFYFIYSPPFAGFLRDRRDLVPSRLSDSRISALSVAAGPAVFSVSTALLGLLALFPLLLLLVLLVPLSDPLQAVSVVKYLGELIGSGAVLRDQALFGSGNHPFFLLFFKIAELSLYGLFTQPAVAKSRFHCS